MQKRSGRNSALICELLVARNVANMNSFGRTNIWKHRFQPEIFGSHTDATLFEGLPKYGPKRILAFNLKVHNDVNFGNEKAHLASTQNFVEMLALVPLTSVFGNEIRRYFAGMRNQSIANFWQSMEQNGWLLESLVAITLWVLTTKRENLAGTGNSRNG